MSTQPANDLADLRERLVRAERELRDRQARTGFADTFARLGGKAEGIKLALSYLDEIARTERA